MIGIGEEREFVYRVLRRFPNSEMDELIVGCRGTAMIEARDRRERTRAAVVWVERALLGDWERL